MTADLADPDAPDRLVADLSARGLTIDGLVNNAGFSRTAGFLNTDPAQHAAMIRVMLTAPVALCRRLAPGMVARGFGRILNVSSLAGQMPATGGDTLYGPIKSFLTKATAGLHLELRGTGGHVTALCPADHVARVGYRACEANRPKVAPGLMNNLLAALAKHLPDAVALRMVGGHAKRLKRI